MKIALCFLLVVHASLVSALEVGKPAPLVKFDGKNGGRVEGSPAWSSEEIKGKVFSVFYVDPSKKELNEPLEAAYKAEHFSAADHGSVAIINMAAAWYPNSLIESKLKEKQAEFPNTVYLKDMNKLLVESWGLGDKTVNLVVFDEKGTVLLQKKEPLTPQEIKEVMVLVRKKIESRKNAASAK
jgi:predicted transcriptional regulator